MTTLTEGKHAGEFLISEASGHRSREEITVASGADLSPCTVLGKGTSGTVGAAVADGGNTGDGTIGTVTAGTETETGTYELVCITAATNAGTFEVRAPSGAQLPDDATVAVAYTSDHLNFTIADGAADFVVGDKFTVAVSGTGKYEALDLAGVDGTQKAAGVLYNAANAATADVQAAGIVRDAEVRSSDLTWPAGITAPQQATAEAELAALGIIVR